MPQIPQKQQKQQPQESTQMSEVMSIELEVKQVWIGGDTEWTVLDLFVLNGKTKVAHKCSHKGVFSNVGHCEHGQFIKGLTLITNADGTPYVAPNDYRDGDIWEDVPNNELVCFLVFSDEDTLTWKFVFNDGGTYQSISGQLLREPERYRLIYRDGKVVTNE